MISLAVAAAGWVGVSSPGDYAASQFPPVPRHDRNEIETSPIETPQQMIEARRAAAVMSRSEFLLRCTGLGVLSQSDALQAAHGQIPDSVASLITSWPEQDRFEVQVRWAALTQIERNHPMILVLADLMGLTPEGLDMIFGILTPEE